MFEAAAARGAENEASISMDGVAKGGFGLSKEEFDGAAVANLASGWACENSSLLGLLDSTDKGRNISSAKEANRPTDLNESNDQTSGSKRRRTEIGEAVVVAAGTAGTGTGHGEGRGANTGVFTGLSRKDAAIVSGGMRSRGPPTYNAFSLGGSV